VLGGALTSTVGFRLELERDNSVNSHDVLKDRLAKAERELKSAQKDNTHRYEQLQEMHGRVKNVENANANLMKENQVGAIALCLSL